MIEHLQEIWDQFVFTADTGKFSVVLAVLSVIAMWVLFRKAGRGGWRSLVPGLNLYTLCDIADTSGWKFILFLIPLVGLVYYVIFSFRLARAFGKGFLFGLGLLFFPPLFMLILGFGHAKYRRR